MTEQTVMVVLIALVFVYFLGRRHGAKALRKRQRDILG